MGHGCVCKAGDRDVGRHTRATQLHLCVWLFSFPLPAPVACGLCFPLSLITLFQSMVPNNSTRRLAFSVRVGGWSQWNKSAEAHSVEKHYFCVKTMRLNHKGDTTWLVCTVSWLSIKLLCVYFRESFCLVTVLWLRRIWLICKSSDLNSIQHIWVVAQHLADFIKARPLQSSTKISQSCREKFHFFPNFWIRITC